MLEVSETCLRPAKPAECSIKIKRSEFIAHLIPVSSPQEAKEAYEAIRKEHYNATHNCPAWRVGFPETEEFSSDDGEPGGTAGRPIAGSLKKAGITNALLVVTRYFGGIKLGVRGLIDAYSGAADEVIANAEIEEVEALKTITIKCNYDHLSDINHAVSGAGIDNRRIKSDYGIDITINLSATESQQEHLKNIFESYEGRKLLLENIQISRESTLVPVLD